MLHSFSRGAVLGLISLGAVLTHPLPVPADGLAFTLHGSGNNPIHLVQRLDVTSFPNSIGPRRKEFARTLSDYDFGEIVEKDSVVEVYNQGRSWMYAVKVLEIHGSTALLCITDKALNGGSYFSVTGVEVSEGTDGLLHATQNPVDHPACVERR